MAILLNSYSESNANDFVSMYSGNFPGVGQSFSVASTTTAYSAKMFLYKVGSPTGNAVYKLYNISGTSGSTGIPGGTAFDTSGTIDVSLLTTSPQAIERLFTGASLPGGGNYVLTIEYSGGNSSNYLAVQFDNSAPTHPGNMSLIISGSWNADAADDLCFYVYGPSSVTTYTPTHTIDSYLTGAVPVQNYTGNVWYGGWGGVPWGFMDGASTANIVAQTFTLSHTVDSHLRKAFTVSHTVSSVLRKQVSLTHTVDSALRKQVTVSHTVDSMLRKTVEISHTVDSLLRKTLETSHTVDSFLMSLGTGIFHTVDSVLRTTVEINQTVSSQLGKQYTLSHTVDSHLRAQFVILHTVDSHLRKSFEISHTVSSQLGSQLTKTHTVDSVLVRVNSVSHTVDSTLKSIVTISHTVDSTLYRAFFVIHTVDSVLRGRSDEASGGIGIIVEKPTVSIILDDPQVTIRLDSTIFNIVSDKPQISILPDKANGTLF